MNSQHRNSEHVEAPHHWSPHALPYPPRTPDNNSDSSDQTTRLLEHQQSDSSRQSLSPQPSSAEQRLSPLLPSESTIELYGPDRFLAPSLPARAYDAGLPTQSPLVRFDEDQLAMMAADNSARNGSLKDDLALAAGKVTPGVDDTPYIQYALDALTRTQDESAQDQHFPSGSSNEFFEQRQQYQPSRRIQDEEMGQMGQQPLSLPETAYVDNQLSRTRRGTLKSPPLILRDMAELEKTPKSSPTWPRKMPITDHWIPVTKDMRQSIDPRGRTYLPLTFKPRILRPFSMMILMTLCLLMIAALIFSARYSDQHTGLTPYPGSIYSGQYFVFRILPQLLAAVILLYAQSVVTASLRILPFVSLASEDPRKRYLALFQNIYPHSFLRPQLIGPWQFRAFDLATWLTVFTVPLQSAAFTCIYADRVWTWAPVQPVVWALVALYIILILSTAFLMAFWFGQWTGLMWDVRSIGDLVPLLNRSNAMGSYDQKDLFERGRNFKANLRDRWFDRLGYWRMDDMPTGGIWYTIGTGRDSEVAPGAIGSRPNSDRSADSLDSPGLVPPNDLGRLRDGYLPWYLRNVPVIASVAITAGLLLALLIVSFLPKTRLDDGFVPLLLSRPDKNAFSASNFLYSFVPSLLGMVFFLLFQSVDQSLRVLQPWADLGKVNGAVAHKSILADYAACLPLQGTWRAAKNGHWRVAVVSLMAVLFVFIPILGGGLFIALTATSGQVRMFSSMPVFGVLLAFLFLYVGCLSLLLPHRGQFQLPHPVTCIAGIISFCSAEDLTQDAAFRSVRSRRDLEGRLGLAHEDPREESVWFLGIVPGKDEQRLSVRRMKRFTERRTRSMRAMV